MAKCSMRSEQKNYNINQLFIIHRRRDFIIHYSLKILSNEWWIMKKWIIQNKNPADNNRQDFRFGRVAHIQCLFNFWPICSNPYIFNHGEAVYIIKTKSWINKKELLVDKSSFFVEYGLQERYFCLFLYDFELSQKFKRNHTFPFVRKAY